VAHGIESERPITHLEGFNDGYAGYRKLADRGDVRLAFCWSHVRRGFYEFAIPVAVGVLRSAEQPGTREAVR
jgi:hypothetical protein